VIRAWYGVTIRRAAFGDSSYCWAVASTPSRT
jgi:hypothetical protein